jgi:hypothetical protein
MNYKQDKIRKAAAEVFATENYNLHRSEFVEKAALRYAMVSDQKYFSYAVKHWDKIQHELNVYFTEVA